FIPFELLPFWIRHLRDVVEDLHASAHADVHARHDLGAQPRLVEPHECQLVLAIEECRFESPARSSGNIIDRDDLAAYGVDLIRSHRGDRAFRGFENVIAWEIFDEIAKLQQADGAQLFGTDGADAWEFFNGGRTVQLFPLAL